MATFALIAHWLACIWYAIAKAERPYIGNQGRLLLSLPAAHEVKKENASMGWETRKKNLPNKIKSNAEGKVERDVDCTVHLVKSQVFWNPIDAVFDPSHGGFFRTARIRVFPPSKSDVSR